MHVINLIKLPHQELVASYLKAHLLAAENLKGFPVEIDFVCFSVVVYLLWQSVNNAILLQSVRYKKKVFGVYFITVVKLSTIRNRPTEHRPRTLQATTR